MPNELTPQQKAGKELISNAYKQREKALAFRHRDPKWPLQPDENKDAPKEEKEPHLAAQEVIKGNLSRGSHLYVFPDGKEAKVEKNQSFYAWNAWNYIGSAQGAGRNVYKNAPFDEYRFFSADFRANFFQGYPLAALGEKQKLLSDLQQKNKDLRKQIQSQKNKDEVEKLEYRKRYYNAVGGIHYKQDRAAAKAKKRRKDYTPSRLVGCSLPYRWEAHHILPQNLFYTFLDQDHIELILASTYDINDGRNIIFLPTSPSRIYWKPHQLPNHVGPHPSYDKRVERSFTTLKSRLQAIKGKQLPHPDAPDSIEAKLHEMEQEAFDFLIAKGKRGPSHLK
ncbi:AHH domain-containing protein [Archangium lansingense]|uniref:AHH domain-containing protein n=1 Tax=Archangium lansingense TaxID=2995310 RepID=UPI003B7B44A4